MQVRNLAPHNPAGIFAANLAVRPLLRKSPDLLGRMISGPTNSIFTQDKRLSASSIPGRSSGHPLPLQGYLSGTGNIDDSIPACRKPQKLPVVYEPGEVNRFLGAIENPKPGSS